MNACYLTDSGAQYVLSVLILPPSKHIARRAGRLPLQIEKNKISRYNSVRCANTELFLSSSSSSSSSPGCLPSFGMLFIWPGTVWP